MRTYTRLDGAALATPADCAHLLVAMPEATLRALLQIVARCDSDAALTNAAYAPADASLPRFANALARFYIEAHVHGPVRMSTDVAAVVADACEGAVLTAAIANPVGSGTRNKGCDSRPAARAPRAGVGGGGGGAELVSAGALRAAKAVADAHALRFELLSAPAWLARSVLGRGSSSSARRGADRARAGADWGSATRVAESRSRGTQAPLVDSSGCGSSSSGSLGRVGKGWDARALLPADFAWAPGSSAGKAVLGPAGRGAAVAALAAFCACAWGLAAAGVLLGALCHLAW